MFNLKHKTNFLIIMLNLQLLILKEDDNVGIILY